MELNNKEKEFTEKALHYYWVHVNSNDPYNREDYETYESVVEKLTITNSNMKS